MHVYLVEVMCMRWNLNRVSDIHNLNASDCQRGKENKLSAEGKQRSLPRLFRKLSMCM